MTEWHELSKTDRERVGKEKNQISTNALLKVGYHVGSAGGPGFVHQLCLCDWRGHTVVHREGKGRILIVGGISEHVAHT